MKDTDLFTTRTCTFSPCRKYRYELRIVWDDTKPLAAFIGLNPSTADERNDDPTIRRCRGFAESWGCGGMVMLNLFAFRATKPSDMFAAKDPVGDRNSLAELEARLAFCSGPRVACWGAHGTFQDRGRMACSVLQKMSLQCLAMTANGHPGHPLYLPKTSELRPLEMPEGAR